jgi:hypothetical protein
MCRSRKPLAADVENVAQLCCGRFREGRGRMPGPELSDPAVSQDLRYMDVPLAEAA